MQRSIIYKALRDRAIDILPWLSYVDLQKGQFRNPADNYPIPLPALLIEFQDISASNTLNNQLVELSIRLQLYLELVTDSFDAAEQEEQSIALLDRWDDVFIAFHNYTYQNIARFTRIRELAPEYGNGYILLQSEYRALVNDRINTQSITMNIPEINIYMA